MQFTTIALFATTAIAAALPAAKTTAWNGGRCRVEVKVSSGMSGGFEDMSTDLYDGKGNKVTSYQQPSDAKCQGNTFCYVGAGGIPAGTGGLPQVLSIVPNSQMIQPLATFTYAGFTFDGNSNVCQMHTKGSGKSVIATGMTCGFSC